MSEPSAFGCINNTIKVAAGHYVDLADPDHATIEIWSMAAALSKICRFGGHTPVFYSVAEHCVHATRLAIEDGVGHEILSAVLLHDATEAYLGDVVKPLKMMLPAYTQLEQRMQSAIERAFLIDFAAHEAIIKRYDREMLKAEKMVMWPSDSEKWAGFTEISLRLVDFKFWRPSVAEAAFLTLAEELGLI